VTFDTDIWYNPTCHSLCRAFYLLAKNRTNRPALLWLCGSGSSFSYSLQLVGKYPPAGPEDSPSLSDNFAVTYGFELSQRNFFVRTSRSRSFVLRAGLKTLNLGTFFIIIQYFTFPDNSTLNITLFWKVRVWGSLARTFLAIRRKTSPSTRRKDKALKVDHTCLFMCQRVNFSSDSREIRHRSPL